MRNVYTQHARVREENFREIWFAKITPEVRIKLTAVFSSDNPIISNLQNNYWICLDKIYQETYENRRS